MVLSVPEIYPSHRRWASLFGSVVIAVGCLALIGWRFEIALFRSVLPGFPSMNLMTALAFILSGAALRMSVMPTPDRRLQLFVHALGFMVALLGLLKLSEYLFGWNLGINLLLFKEQIAAVSPTSQMSAVTALNLLLLGFAFILQDLESWRGRRLAETFILLAMFLSMTAVIGYIYDNEFFYHSSMALNTALTFILLCSGLLSARPDYGLMKIITSVNMGGLITRRLIPAAFLLSLLLDWMKLAGQHAGWYDTETGSALFTAFRIAIMVGFIWWISTTIDRIDAERQSNDEKLRESREELSKQTHILKSVLLSMGEGVIVAGLDGKFLIWNLAAERIVSMGSADIFQGEWSKCYGLYRSDQVTLYPVDQLPLSRAIRGESVDADEVFLRNAKMPKGGWLSVTGRPLRDESGTLLGGVIVFTDITKRKLAENRFQRVLESAPDAIVIVDQGGRIVMANTQTERLFGYAGQELVGQPVEILAPERFRVAHAGHRAGFVANPHARPMGSGLELYGRRKDKTEFPVEISLSPMETDDEIWVISTIRDITERRRAESDLRESRERSQFLLDSAAEAIYGIDLQGFCTFCNHSSLRILGYSAAAELIGKNMHDLVHHSKPDGSPYPMEECKLYKAFRAGEGNQHGDEVLWRSDGSSFPVEYWSYPLRQGGEIIGSVVAFIDITERKRSEEEMGRSNLKLTAIVDELEARKREMSLLSEMGDLLQTCHTLQEANDVILRSLRHLFPIESGALYMLMASRNLVERTVAWGASLPEERLFPPEDCLALRKGQIHRVDDSDSDLICPHVKQPLSTGYLCIPMQAQNDVLGILHLNLSKSDDPGGSDDDKEHLKKTQQRLAATAAEQIALALSNILLRDVLRNQAIRDSLTGLFNRRFLEEMLVKEICRAQRGSQRIGVVMIDIDHFKRYNDTHGHEAGDAVLSALGQFLKEKLRGGDTACRYGGEEFTITLPGASLEDSLRKAQSLCEAVKQLKPQFRGRSLEGITLSLGVAVFPDHGSNAEDLLRAADQALYQAKAEGRDRVICAHTPASRFPPKNSPGG